MNIVRTASIYPIWLCPLPREGRPGEWINLANIESLIFDPEKEVYILRFTSGAHRQLLPERAKAIANEFREISKERRSPPLPKKTK